MKTLRNITFAITLITLSFAASAKGEKEAKGCCQIQTIESCAIALQEDLTESMEALQSSLYIEQPTTFFKVLHFHHAKSNGQFSIMIESEQQYQSDEVQTLLRRAQLLVENSSQASYIIE